MENSIKEKQETAIYRVYYLHGQKNERTGKYLSSFVRVTATDGKEALAKAKKMGVTGNHRLVRWLMPHIEK